MINRRSLLAKLAYLLVHVFDIGFLGRTKRVTVEEMAALLTGVRREFDAEEIRETWVAVGQDDGKHMFEVINAKSLFEFVKDGDDFHRVFVSDAKKQHEL